MIVSLEEQTFFYNDIDDNMFVIVEEFDKERKKNLLYIIKAFSVRKEGIMYKMFCLMEELFKYEGNSKKEIVKQMLKKKNKVHCFFTFEEFKSFLSNYKEF